MSGNNMDSVATRSKLRRDYVAFTGVWRAAGGELDKTLVHSAWSYARTLYCVAVVMMLVFPATNSTALAWVA